MTTESITWHPATTPPDADRTVLLLVPEADEPVWLGYFDGRRWMWADGDSIDNCRVTHWADLPAGPAEVSA